MTKSTICTIADDTVSQICRIKSLTTAASLILSGSGCGNDLERDTIVGYLLEAIEEAADRAGDTAEQIFHQDAQGGRHEPLV